MKTVEKNPSMYSNTYAVIARHTGMCKSSISYTLDGIYVKMAIAMFPDELKNMDKKQLQQLCRRHRCHFDELISHALAKNTMLF